MIFDSVQKVLIFNTWSFDSLESLYYSVYRLRPKEIYLDCSDEWEILGSFSDPFFEKLKDFTHKNNIEVHVMLGSVRLEDYPDRVKEALENCTLHFLPFSFITSAYHLALGSVSLQQRTVSEENKFPFLYYIFVNRPHPHRCLFVDLLHREKLVEHGKYTWNILSKQFLKEPYQFENWVEHRIDGNDKYDKQYNHVTPEKMYFESLIEIVLESTTTVNFITEKTVKPLVFGKPFIAFACKDFHHILASYGFKFYDELFDYTFDRIEDDKTRAETIIRQLKDLSQRTDYNEIYRTLIPKLQYNQELIKRLAQMHSNDRMNILDGKSMDLHLYRTINETHHIIQNLHKKTTI